MKTTRKREKSSLARCAWSGTAYALDPSFAPYSHALRRETNRFLTGAADWRWFVTLTVAHDDMADRRFHEAFRTWARITARDVFGAHLRIGWVYAPQARGVLHAHALVALAELAARDVSADDIRRTWTLGTVDVQPVFDRVGAIAYMLHHTPLNADDIRRAWVLNTACHRRGRCHRARCAVAPGPWSTT